MEIIDLDNQAIKWSIKSHRRTNHSSYHDIAYNLLHEIFPSAQILEEVSLPLKKSETLFFDFYLPLFKLAIEVHGEQHYHHTPFYHSHKLDFVKQQVRDKNKREWCQLNNITLIELPHYDDIKKWRQQIVQFNSE